MISSVRQAIRAAVIIPAILGGTTCIEISQKASFRQAVVVFRGTVLDVEYLYPDKRDGPFVTTFRADRKWKGPVTSVMIIYSRRPWLNGEYQVGRQYIVYAVNDINQNASDIRKASKGHTVYSIGFVCPQRLPADVAEESRKLGRGHPVKEVEQTQAKPAR